MWEGGGSGRKCGGEEERIGVREGVRSRNGGVLIGEKGREREMEV